MHACAGKIAHDGAGAIGKPQNDDNAAGLIFSQKAAGLAADDHDRLLVTVGLHVDPRTVSGVPLHIQLAAPHGIARGVADAAADDDAARVHGVAHGVLCVAAHLDAGAVEIGTQRVAGRARYGEVPRWP